MTGYGGSDVYSEDRLLSPECPDLVLPQNAFRFQCYD